ncbi:putative thiolase/acyl transferase [Mycobacterium xenopi 4042]|uniref:Putative thiolase/acyl transferase n=1 Tax=Mycobacterium xenopi 4042 TaxID=1299334 RepID=X8AFH6_MYCXE|nr:putative thiolase/acyl transferase [Mycobacterium xenopi 4042]
MTLILLDEYRLTGDAPAGAFVRDGQIGPMDCCPLTPAGPAFGYYLQGMTPLAEAVIQLRGAGGARQVPGAAIALVGGIGGRMDHHAALVLERAA